MWACMQQMLVSVHDGTWDGRCLDAQMSSCTGRRGPPPRLHSQQAAPRHLAATAVELDAGAVLPALRVKYQAGAPT